MFVPLVPVPAVDEGKCEEKGEEPPHNKQMKSEKYEQQEQKTDEKAKSSDHQWHRVAGTFEGKFVMPVFRMVVSNLFELLENTDDEGFEEDYEVTPPCWAPACCCAKAWGSRQRASTKRRRKQQGVNRTTQTEQKEHKQSAEERVKDPAEGETAATPAPQTPPGSKAPDFETEEQKGAQGISETQALEPEKHLDPSEDEATREETTQASIAANVAQRRAEAIRERDEKKGRGPSAAETDADLRRQELDQFRRQLHVELGVED